MKKLGFAHGIIALTALAFAASTAIAQTAQQQQQLASLASSNNAFACDLYAQLKGTEGNLFFSPFSVSSALAMAYAGAKGDTADQMRKVLRFPASSAETHAGFAALLKHFAKVKRKGNVQLNIANSLWPQKNTEAPLLESYLALVKQNYGVGITSVDYQNAEPKARAQINRCVEKKTQDKITNIIGGPISRDTRLVLVNAVYFKGDWSSPFETGDTRPAPFYIADGRSVQTPLMEQTSEFDYAALSNCQIIQLPYEGEGFSMLVVLPVDKSLTGLEVLEKDLIGKQIAGWKAQLKNTRVQMFIPKFKFECGKILFVKVLQNLGLIDAFALGKADFSGMNGRRDFSINDVLQKAFVDVNESGTEAAAASSVSIAVGGIALPEPPPPVFRADHPFLFFIQDNATGSILFMGRVVNPAAQ